MSETVVCLPNLTSPKKRKAPTERKPLPVKKKLQLAEEISFDSSPSASVNNEEEVVEEFVEISANEPSTSLELDPPDLERKIAEQSQKIAELEEKLKQSEDEINNLRRENTELNGKLAECERQQHFNQNRSSSFFKLAGSLPAKEAPGISSSVRAHAAIRDDQNIREKPRLTY